jgi:glycosylphosphatidylinositol transamidase (GPIT) subunit GPI8
MILKIYIIGLSIMLIWWAVLAFLTFNENYYDSIDSDDKKSIEELHDLLNHFSSDNPQKAFVIISLIVCILWPIFLPYIIIKNIFK